MCVFNPKGFVWYSEICYYKAINHKEGDFMAKIDTTLLDLDRAPTLDELKAFFKKHDWSAAKLTDPNSRSAEKTSDMEEIKKVIDAEIKNVTHEKGITVPSKYLENKMRVEGERGNVFEYQGNPLMELRDNIEDVVSDAVYEIAVNHEDILNIIFSKFDFNDPDFAEKADDSLHNAVGTLIDVVEYEKLSKVIHEMSAFEDFNPNIKSNFRAEDHNRRWYHTDTAHPTLPDPEFAEQIHDNNPNPEDVAISNVAVEEYWKTLDPNDRIIIKMLMAGFTQKEAAIEVGIANNSGVSKRLSKIRKDFTEKTGIKL